LELRKTNLKKVLREAKRVLVTSTPQSDPIVVIQRKNKNLQ